MKNFASNWLFATSDIHVNIHNRISSWTLMMGSKGRPETSVRNYHYTLRNAPEESRYDVLGGASLN